ncbi:MAG: alpha/beta hydrolase family protein [Actinobacteria bacterium]|nr:alpha/beta hydrolase family protein [Actinomycetota bacterium]NIS30827.1 alpha/beta hydrolase family protein [Actinomycetota bacterium]NIU18997.1 alpha/beta hydrolase family protein [Actinomycetota bacterium]NIU66019.1 alpha/beta hydrolase family protein [Actinomycetota bacterium]NIV86876.1 alpha/beta hydrolase family protein [Actinomycetota bacterium]
MHWLDRASGLALARTPGDRRVFRDGWGDEDDLEWFREIAGTEPPIADVPITVQPATADGAVVATEIEFDSPIAERLPERARRARARILTTREGTQRVVVLMAAWNDHDYRTRMTLAELLLSRGIGVAMLENPFYGSRRPVVDDPQPMRDVATFGLMGRATVLEGRVLAKHLHDVGHTVGISGFSMGGNMAAFVASMVPFAVASAPLAAAHSPGPPFVSGILGVTVDWEALGGDDPDTRARLEEHLLLASVTRFDPPLRPDAAVMVAGTVDGYVPTAAVQAVHRHWPGSELDWVNVGHGALIWRRKERLVDGITRSFARLADG